MKKCLELIKELGLILLLFVLVSAVTVADSSYKVSVTIVQSSSSEDSGKMNTVINTYSKEDDSPKTSVTSVISGSGSSVITSEDDTIPDKSTDSEDSGANDNQNPGITSPELQLDGSTYEEYNDEFSEWLSYMIDNYLLVTIDDFPQDTTNIINVE